MKKLTVIFVLLLLFSCKDNKRKNISKFSEEDAYELINTYFLEQLNQYDSHSIIYLNNRILKKPEYQHTYFGTDSIVNMPFRKISIPVFSKEYWKINNIKNIRVIDCKEFDSFFRENDSIDLEKLWSTKFNNEYIHNVSYPIYNPKTKIAVIEDYHYKPFLYCGTGLDNFYYYRKTLNGWERIK
ncbi:hypothetical protein LXD69_09935 [Flavobacterium sediminilitoris]|uniref:Lipoprotein n=1 Tax=Flavobacterium sediminilitoris TaxID=2024526 RepID=A0ABY4HJ36_9FLAO|nr:MULTISPECIES: hypothetical protein [Flavobacterium]UOX32371.1 hypothetical protein LXD69_09935 [Flavobacterium sediminilitoris]